MNLRYVVAITFGAIVMYNAVQLIGADRLVLLARNLDGWLDLYDVIDLDEVHVLLAKHETLQVNDEDLGQRVDLCLLRHVAPLTAIVALQKLTVRQSFKLEELVQTLVKSHPV